MAATSSLRSLGHGERMTLTGHLTELRARLMVCALALTVLFAGCLWQSRPLLDVLNRPLSTVTTLGSGLPDAGRSLGRGIREFKGAITGHDDEPDERGHAVDEPTTMVPEPLVIHHNSPAREREPVA